jgi:hypothetical protein
MPFVFVVTPGDLVGLGIVCLGLVCLGILKAQDAFRSRRRPE